MNKNVSNFSFRIEFSILAFLLLVGIFCSSSFSAQEPPDKFTLDFEKGNLRGWFKTGAAFDFQPTLGDNPTKRLRGQPSNHQGNYWIGTFEKHQGKPGQMPGGFQGDRPTGTLTSPSFRIPSGFLSFLIGGGKSFETRVELVEVEGDPIEHIEREERIFVAFGSNNETMHRVSWDLSPYVGKIGKIRIVDASSSGWGHINVDDFKFTSFLQPIMKARPFMPKVEKPSIVKPTPPSRPKFQIFFEARNRNPVIGEIVNFIGRVEPSAREVQYQFDFGDGLRSGWLPRPDFNYSYNKPGKFYAFLTVNVGGRNIQSEKIPITVRSIQLILKCISNPPLYVGRPVKFEVTPEPPNPSLKFQFHFGDDSVSDWIEEQVVEHVYSADRTYEVFAFTRRGLPRATYARRQEVPSVKSNSLKVSIQKPPPQFRVYLRPDKSRIKEGESIRFRTDFEPLYQGVEYKFDFGDGHESNWMRDPETGHIYRNSGEFQAFVRVRIIRDKVLAESPPVGITVEDIKYIAYFSVDNRSPFVGKNVTFEGGIEPGAENVRYRFDFGDGERSEWLTRPMADHFYSEIGRYHAVLTAAVGKRTIQSDEIVINVLEINLKLNIISEAPHYAGKPVEIEARPVLDISDLQFQFYFGDGSVSEWARDKVVEYIYSAPREYQAFALVQKAGKTLARSNPVRIIIQMEYKVDLRVNKRNPFEGEDVRFEGGIEPQAENVRYRFDFGDGERSDRPTRPMVDHFYNESGRYRAVLTAVIGENTFQSDGIVIDVGEINLNLELISEAPHYARTHVEFEAKPVPDIPDLQFQYHYGDGTVTEWVEDKVIEHVYLDSGVFNAYVTARRREKLIAGSAVVEIRVVIPDYEIVLEADNEAILSGNSIRFKGIIRPTPEQVQLQFDYGDEEKSNWLSEPVSTHVYSEPGTYVATLAAKVEEDSFQSNEVNIRVGVSEFKPRIEAWPDRIKPGRSVVFSAVTEPRVNEIEYMFIFGDGEESTWSVKAEAEHTYPEEGTYPAYVAARWAQKYDSMSDPILIKVSSIPPWLIWAVIVVGALIVFGGGAYFSSRIIRTRVISRAKEFMLQIEPKKDLGIQNIKIEKAEQSNLRLRIKPVIDTGNQKIQVDGTLIIQKGRNHD